MPRDNYEKAIDIVTDVLADIQFVLIGAQAVNSWMDDDVRVRATLDIDFLVKAEEGQAVQICQRFRDAGYTAHLRMGKITDEVPLYIRLTSDTLPQVDLLFALRQMEKKVVDNGLKLDNLNIKIATVEDLVVLKVIAGRETDLLDVKNLLKHSYTKADIKKIKADLLNLGAAFLERLEKIVR